MLDPKPIKTWRELVLEAYNCQSHREWEDDTIKGIYSRICNDPRLEIRWWEDKEKKDAS